MRERRSYERPPDALHGLCRDRLRIRRLIRRGPTSVCLCCGAGGSSFAAKLKCGSEVSYLVLLTVRVRARIGLAVYVGERRGAGAALLLVLVLLRLFLFPVASHLTFRHGVLRMSSRMIRLRDG